MLSRVRQAANGPVPQNKYARELRTRKNLASRLSDVARYLHDIYVM